MPGRSIFAGLTGGDKAMSDTRQLINCIGNTPLLRLNRASEQTGCEILGKAEFLNPGGSVKDRAALGMIRAARESGELRPGGIIVEGTAGNTGIGLAMVGNALGHRSIIVMPDNQSASKIETLRAYGAEVRAIPAVPYRNPEHFVHTSGRLAAELDETHEHGAFWANQGAQSMASSAPSARAARWPGSRGHSGRENQRSASACPIRAAQGCTISSPMAR